MLTDVEKKEMRQIINTNKYEIFILSLDEMDRVVNTGTRSNHLKEKWRTFKKKVEFSANYYATGSDTFLLAKLMSDLGYVGTTVYVKYYGGKPHIILKGYPGLRKLLNATKYGVKNPKILKMGLGKFGAINAAKSGGVLTIVLLSAYRVIDYFLTDSATLSQLVGTLATDVVKVGIATGASIAAATVAAALFTVAIGPLLAAIVVGVLVSVALTYIDDRYHITERVIAGLDELNEGIEAVVERKKQALISASHEITADVAESVIDYAMERAQRIFINMMNHWFKNLTTPRI